MMERNRKNSILIENRTESECRYQLNVLDVFGDINDNSRKENDVPGMDNIN